MIGGFVSKIRILASIRKCIKNQVFVNHAKQSIRIRKIKTLYS